MAARYDYRVAYELYFCGQWIWSWAGEGEDRPFYHRADARKAAKGLRRQLGVRNVRIERQRVTRSRWEPAP